MMVKGAKLYFSEVLFCPFGFDVNLPLSTLNYNQT